jgi:tetratricopeptide (TPR) repeat protein
MQLLERPTAVAAVIDTATHPISGPNQKMYARLKTSLRLNLRRQIFLAVCDDLELRNSLVAKLQAELAPRFVSLNLHLGDPNPMAQVTRWLMQHGASVAANRSCSSLGFQILGVEHLTHQPAAVQKRFLTHLQAIEYYLPALECAMVLWLPRPWLHSVRQSAPAFLDWHTAIFEFEGDPTPSRVSLRLSKVEMQHWTGPVITNDLGLGIHPICEPQLTAGQPGYSGAPAISSPNSPVLPSEVQAPVESQETTQLQEPPPPQENIWDILTRDLALLNQVPEVGVPTEVEQATGKMMAADVGIATDQSATDQSATDQSATDQSVVDRSETDSVPVSDALSNAGLEDFRLGDVGMGTDAIAAVTPVITTEPATPADRPGMADALVMANTVLTDASVAETPAGVDRFLGETTDLDLSDLILAAIAQDPTSERHHAGLQILQQIEQLRQHPAITQTATAPKNTAPKNTAPKALVTAYYTLSRLYREGIEQGDGSEQTLEIAIAAHEQTLRCLETPSSLWADVANDLGNLYWMQARSAVEADVQIASLERAILSYQLALAKTNPQTAAQTYAMIQNNLGSAYGDLGQYREPAENLQKSVLAYETALRYRTASDDPARYAATQNNLGTACWNLAQHQQPVARLNQAIAAYQEALRYYTTQREPLHHAMIQNNLGTAYWNLAQYIQSPKSAAKPGAKSVTGKGNSVSVQEANLSDATHSEIQPQSSPAELFQAAIAAYENALAYRTLEGAPAAYAATQNNLGTAYWDLANLPQIQLKERQKHLQSAITAYEAAITAVDLLAAQTGHRPALNFDVSATANNLGLAYYQLASDRQHPMDASDRQTYLERSLNRHLQALQGWEGFADFHQATLDYVVQTVRSLYSEAGIQGQNLALSKIPAHLLPQVMSKL